MLKQLFFLCSLLVSYHFSAVSILSRDFKLKKNRVIKFTKTLNKVAGSLTLVILLLNSSAIYPIVIRHDRDDANYQKLGDRYRYACVDVAGAAGTLIAPRWVLAAAHTLDKMIPGRPVYDSSVLPKANIGGQDYVIEKIV